MIHSIVSLNDIFYTAPRLSNSIRSSNPYDYINDGYYLDNTISGGEKYVRINSNISGYRTGFDMDISNK